MLGHDASMTDDARHVVYWEGRTTEDGRRLLPNSTTWDEALPIMQRSEDDEWDNRLFGMMSEIRREPDGSITALCTPDIPEGMWLSAGFMWTEYDVMGVGDDQVMEFSQGTLQYAMLQKLPSIWETAS